MKDILRMTPITINGVDQFEVLVHDDSLVFDEICDKCCYNGWSPLDGDCHDCSVVHDCFSHAKTWFELRPCG